MNKKATNSVDGGLNGIATQNALSVIILYMETDSNLNHLSHHLVTSIFNGLHSSLLQATNPRHLLGLLLLLQLTPPIECAKLLRMFIGNHFLLHAIFMVFFHLLLALRAAIESLPGGCNPHGIVRKEKCLKNWERTNYDANFQGMDPILQA